MYNYLRPIKSKSSIVAVIILCLLLFSQYTFAQDTSETTPQVGTVQKIGDVVLIALPAAYLHLRKGSIGLKIFLGVIAGIAFHLGNSLFSHLGLLNTWPPVTVAIFPSFLALIFGAIIFSWVQKNNI